MANTGTAEVVQLHDKRMITRFILICQYVSQLKSTFSSTLFFKVEIGDLGSERCPSASTIALIGMRLNHLDGAGQPIPNSSWLPL